MSIFIKKKKNKVFCIGFNKTGTTTIERTFKEHGFLINDQGGASGFIDDWAKRDFKAIINYCKDYEAFQDFPFSFPFTYIALDFAFPKSKFILTVRDSPEQWYKSITLFHGKLWANGRVPPTKEDLENAVRYYKGRPWQVNRFLYKSPENDPYNEKVLKQQYMDHIEAVKEYFRFRENDLLVLNIAETNAYSRFCDFLELKPKFDKFPWENKT